MEGAPPGSREPGGDRKFQGGGPIRRGVGAARAVAGAPPVAGTAAPASPALPADPSPAAGPERPRGRRPGPTLLLALVPVALLAVLGWQLRWMNEDGFIYLRVVDNLLAGHGPVFNPGERVEAYTSPLWTGLLAIVRAPLGGASFEYIAVVLGLALSVGGLAAASAGAAVLARAGGRRGLLVPLGALVIACLPPFWDFSTSGLETGLVFGWTGIAFLGVALHAARDEPGGGRRAPGAFALAFLVGLGPLVRPDLALISAGLLASLLFAERPARARRLAALVVWAAALPLAYQVFRMGWFGAPIPSTAIAKEAGMPFWGRGLRYAWDALAPYALWGPLAVLGGLLAARVRADLGAGRRRIAVAGAALAIAGLLHAVYVIRLGGDYMHARMLLPSLFALLAPVAVVALPRARAAAVAALLVVPWALVAATSLRGDSVLDPSDYPEQVIDQRRKQLTSPSHPHPVTLADHDAIPFPQPRIGRLLATHAGGERELVWEYFEQPIVADGRTIRARSPAPHPDVRPLAGHRGEVIARTGSLGRVGYAAGDRVRLVDPLGLADPVAARQRLERRTKAGHEKELPIAWFFARFADPATLGSYPPLEPLLPDIAAARRALACPPLRDILAAATEPMSFARFRENLGIAVRERSFRMPADPQAAARELCP